MKLTLILISLAGLTVTAFVTDCACAPQQWQPGIVRGKWIKPAWTEITLSGDGKATITGNIYHPQEYYIDVRCGWSTGSVMVNSWDFGKYSSGDECQVEFRHGKLTDYSYLSITTQ